MCIFPGQLPADSHLKFSGGNGDRTMERAAVQKFSCDKCPYVTLIRNNFERHVILHGCKHRFTCEYCDYSVPNFHRLLQHKKLHVMPNPLNNFPANKDEISTNGGHDDLDLYENSEEFVEPKKVYRCDRCPFTNARRDNLLAHLKFHMIRSTLQCSYCDYSVSKQHLLTQHMKVHFTNDGQFKSSSSGLPLNDTDGADNNQDLSQTQSNNEITHNAEKTSSKTNSQPTEQPEYIDLSELPLKEDDNNNGEDSGKENQSQNEKGQFFDQSTFQSSEKKPKIEIQHLAGNKY